LFNIHIFPNNSIAGIFIAMLLLFIFPFFKKAGNVWQVGLIVIPLVFLGVLLHLSNSRSGWLGFAAGFSFIICRSGRRRKRMHFLLLTTGIFCILLSVLYFYKRESSSGRKHIYRISWEMFSDNLVSGIGPGKYKVRFNEYQASYFSTRSIESKRALLADNSFYAFNDYLQWVIETGLIGLLLLLLFSYLTIKRIIYLLKEYPASPAVKAIIPVLICVATASLFSYPMQVLPIQAFVLICLCILGFYPFPMQESGFLHKATSFTYKGLTLLIFIAFLNKAWSEYSISRMEKDAFRLARTGYKTAAIQQYKQLLNKFPSSGYNWYFYAEQLYYANRLPEAYESLKKGMCYYVDNKVYRLKAELEKEMGWFAEAEKSYLRAIYMVPNRMSSRFNLLNFYLATKDTAKALYWGTSIINMPIKVPSERTAEMFQQTKQILKGLQE
jgi:tetratricopeptide (TPR) repeat protein